MNNPVLFYEKYYKYILSIVILIVIIGFGLFFYKQKNNEKIAAIGDKYLKAIFNNNNDQNARNNVSDSLRQIRDEKYSDYATLSALILAQDAINSKNIAEIDANLLTIIDNHKSNKVLSDYALYLYAQNLLARNNNQKFAEIIDKLNDNNFTYKDNAIELIALYNIGANKTEEAKKILSEADNIKDLPDSLKERMMHIKNELN